MFDPQIIDILQEIIFANITENDINREMTGFELSRTRDTYSPVDGTFNNQWKMKLFYMSE